MWDPRPRRLLNEQASVQLQTSFDLSPPANVATTATTTTTTITNRNVPTTAFSSQPDFYRNSCTVSACPTLADSSPIHPAHRKAVVWAPRAVPAIRQPESRAATMALNLFRILGDFSHLASIFVLLHKMRELNGCAGISFKSQALYFFVYVTRYLDLFSTTSIYNVIFKILFISSQGYIIYLMTTSYKPTNDPNLDTFRVQYLLGFAFTLAVLFPYTYTFSEIMWAFSIWLESVAILPQLFMLQRTGEAETITTHYLFALGIYRALYIPNWIYRYFAESGHHIDWIAVVAGLLQTVLYSDFFWIYYTSVMKGKKFKLPV
ncbi:hypothetical protein MKZ38_008727 [Zalerion maritima]|uniref:ER lumen protein-retaining receptor n=1 Tax=Zalerion maritima TaxID=339359 RepID=A0AAD5RGT1_9PEZI|nr:hypothetical protein MKZ38_008727 [Zalerion maritima]